MKEKRNRQLLRLFGLGLLVLIFGLIHFFLAGVMPVSLNKGISLGFYFDGIEILILVILVFVFLILIKNFNLGLYLVWCGGLINFVNRLIFGYVYDYFDLIIVSNNLPDFLIFLGIVIFLIRSNKNEN